MLIEDIIAMIGFGLLAAWVLWLLFRRQQIQTRARLQRLETFDRLVAKFGSAQELVDFLETPAGRRLMEDPVPAGPTPQASIRRYLSGGVVFLFLGAASLVNAARIAGETDINYVRQALDLNYWGTLMLALGLALLLVAGLTHLMTRQR
jgi:hypothetical protein